MNDENIIKKYIGFLGTILNVIGLAIQFLQASAIKDLLLFKDVKFLNSFSFGGLVFGIVIIGALYKFRFALSQKIYISHKKGSRYRPLDRFDEASSEHKLHTQSKPDEDKPFYIVPERLAVMSIFISLLFFIGVLLLEDDRLKGVCYFLSVLLLTYTSTVFTLHVYNLVERRQQEKNSSKAIQDNIKEYFQEVPKIKYTGEVADFSGTPALRKVWIEVNEKKYEAITGLWDPTIGFSIYELKDAVNKDTKI